MITRKDAISEFWMMYPNKFSYNKAEILLNKIYDSLEQHIKSLEAQLANTEQLTCDGCKWQKYPDQIFDQINGCEICSRYKENYDRYQPKDTQ